jgi:transitional endoplasmic reticulum ATPase
LKTLNPLQGQAETLLVGAGARLHSPTVRLHRLSYPQSIGRARFSTVEEDPNTVQDAGLSAGGVDLAVQHRRNTQLVLPSQTYQPIASLAKRLRNGYDTERLGGTLPRGVLFHGAPGTGKTATAKALAVECNWTYLEAAGAELLADRSRLAKLFEEAHEKRPALLFIDEADDLLRDRSQNAVPAATNQLLVLMDGAGEAVKDVAVIAATNHLESIDPALLRSGRFTEKIYFAYPGRAELSQFITEWLDQRPPAVRWDCTTHGLVQALLGWSIPDAEGVLQYALNTAISRQDAVGTGRAVRVLETDVADALRVVCEGRCV